MKSGGRQQIGQVTSDEPRRAERRGQPVPVGGHRYRIDEARRIEQRVSSVEQLRAFRGTRGEWSLLAGESTDTLLVFNRRVDQRLHGIFQLLG